MCRVSVVIPAYEAGHFLADAVESVRLQQGLRVGTDIEVVVADDGATRADSLLALEQVSLLPWVRVVRTSGRTGPSNARNLAVAAATGEWLSFLDADDLYSADSLGVRLQAAARHPDVDCVATDYAEFDAGLRTPPPGLAAVIENFPSRRVPVEQAYRQRTELRLSRPVRAFVGAIPLWTGSVLVRRSLFNALGGFPTAHFIGEDLHLWLRIAASTDIVYLPQITAFCRKGHASLTSRESSLNLKMAKCYEHLQSDPLMQPVQHALHRLISDAYVGESYLARQQRAAGSAAMMALQALRWAPGSVGAWKALLGAPLPARG